MDISDFKQISSLFNISKLRTYITTQFQQEIKNILCDNGGEYINGKFQNLCEAKGISFCLSRPHTSPQNGKAEIKICSINNIIITLLIHAYHCLFGIILYKWPHIN